MPNPWRWKWALIFLIAIEVISQVIIFNQPAIFEQARDERIEQSEAKMLKDKIDPERIRQARLEMEDIQPFFFIFLNSTRAIMETVARLFMITGGFWILLRAVLNKFPTLNPAMEVAGLSMGPLFWGLLVKLGVVLGTGRMDASPSAALFVSYNDPLNIVNLLMTLLNPFYFWTCLLLALAAINIWKTKPKTTIVWVYLGWIILWFGFAFLQKSISLRGA